MSKTAGFGWEISNVHNDGADVYFKVNTAMTLNVIDIDVSCYVNYAPTTAGPAEVLCTAAVSRCGPPSFNGGNAAYITSPTSCDFGNVQVYNPAGVSVGNNPTLAQDSFMAIMLKTYVPSDGSGAYTSRHVTTPPNLSLNVGDYLVFHMDHAGVQVDTEMQVVLTYQ